MPSDTTKYENFKGYNVTLEDKVRRNLAVRIWEIPNEKIYYVALPSDSHKFMNCQGYDIIQETYVKRRLAFRYVSHDMKKVKYQHTTLTQAQC